MKRVVIIPTEKEQPTDMIVLEKVLKTISPQVDDILLVKNHRTEKKFGLSYTRIIPSNVIELFCKKNSMYMTASVVNVALDYIEKNYKEPIFLMTLGDDCITQRDYVKQMYERREEKIVYAPYISWVEYDYDVVQYIHFIGKRYPMYGSREDIPSLEYIQENLERVGDTIILNGVSGYIWEPKCGLREDTNFDGHWGYEDTDFKMQMLEKGYKIVICPTIRFWHIQTEYKRENRDVSAHKTPNRKRFHEKWGK